MKRALQTRSINRDAADSVEIPAPPAGAPAWVTPELLAQTIDTWQPYYQFSLTTHDALEILLNVTELFE